MIILQIIHFLSFKGLAKKDLFLAYFSVQVANPFIMLTLSSARNNVFHAATDAGKNDQLQGFETTYEFAYGLDGEVQTTCKILCGGC
uniref:Uncharacterized protein n=1 Tax=Panagrolaimus sp. ES5 TaxID=591445 RepID=A0AC34EZL6_9BILA